MQELQNRREAKRKEREAHLEWKKPRDDLECDDLKVACCFVITTIIDIFEHSK